jgi:hypothetical protein
MTLQFTSREAYYAMELARVKCERIERRIKRLDTEYASEVDRIRAARNFQQDLEMHRVIRDKLIAEWQRLEVL